jgi:hypothetical protein
MDFTWVKCKDCKVLLQDSTLVIKDKTSKLPIFISLGSLEGMTLEEYLLKKWLPDAIKLFNSDFKTTSEIEEQLKTRFYKGDVWLLLDGVDEMGESSPGEALRKISQALTDWLGQARVILTCRLNVWDAITNNHLPGFDFDTYKTQEFKPEDVDKFIEEWFKYDNKIQEGEELKAKLRQPGKERIYELVTNPLRLSLLCQIFYNNKHNDLPETKAELFGLYTRYFYDWKPELVPQNFNYTLKQELHQALGRLALAGINSDARFRLNESFAVKEMGQDLFDLACHVGVGWLNLVDRDARSDEAVYAFFHPNFQEYFAALVIDDWHYFLNHNNDNPNPFIKHNNQDCVYLIFEPQWKEVILLWFGLRDIVAQDKEDFIYSLITFKDGCGSENFYGFKAYFLAAAAIGEFRESDYTNQVIRQLIIWGFNQLDDEQNTENDLCYKIRKSSQSALKLINSETTITILKKYVIQDKEHSMEVIDYLTEVGIGNESIIELFAYLLYSSKEFTDDKIFNNHIILSLGEIGIGSQKAITRLLETADYIISIAIYIEELSISSDISSQNLDMDKLQNIKWKLNDSLRDNLESLEKIGIGNQKIITWLQENINFIPDQESRIKAANILWQINPGDILALNVIEETIYNTHFDYIISIASSYLEIIAKSDERGIDVFIKILFTATHIMTIQITCEYLGRVGFGNIKAIEALVKIMLCTEDNETCRIACESLGEIGVGCSEVIEALTKILVNSQDDYVRRQAADSLLKMNPGNTIAIKELTNLVYNSKDIWLRRDSAISLYQNVIDQRDIVLKFLQLILENNHHLPYLFEVAETLLEINPYNKPAIETLIHLACVPFDYMNIRASKKLCKIGNNNRIVIELLIEFIQSEINEFNRIKIVKILSKIDSQNSFLIKQINNLIDNYSNIEALEILASINPRHSKVTEILKIIIHENAKKFDGLSGISNVLKKIQKKELLFQVVSIISDYINKPIFNQDHEDDNQCYEILWHCAQNMTYPEFYRAWHGNTPTIQNLENQFTDTHSFLTQLQPTTKTYPLPLNLKTLHNETDIIEISQEICNQIYLTAFTAPEEIPTVNNAPQLKSKIPQIKKHLKTENLALIINNCEPNDTIINFCNKLTDVLHIAFITEQPLNPPLRGFPQQQNLLNTIQNWINEIE